MAMRTLARRQDRTSRDFPRNLLRLAIAAALSAAATCPRPTRRRPTAARRRRRHRHPRRHRERDRDQARSIEHRRGDLGRRHRQAAGHQHRGIHLAPAGPHLAARRRPRLGDQPARHRSRLHDRAHERPRTGQHRRQPQRRVRPVSVRAHELGGRLQDAGRAARGPGPGRHDRPAHDAAARLRPARRSRSTCAASRTRTTTSARTPTTRAIARASRSSTSSWTARSASPSATRTSTRRWRRAASARTSRGIRRAAAARSTARAARPAGCSNNPGVAPGQFATNGMKVRADMGSTERDGFMAHPAVRAERHLQQHRRSLLLDDGADRQRAQPRGEPRRLPGAVLRPAPFPDGTVFGYSDTTIENDTVVAGTLNNVVPLARNFLFTTEDEILAGGWRNEFQLGDDWSLVADISYSKAQRDQISPRPETQSSRGRRRRRSSIDTGTFELRGNSNMPSLSFDRDYADPAQVLVGPTIYGAGYTKKPHIEDELTSFRLDATREARDGLVPERVVRRELQRPHQGQDLARSRASARSAAAPTRSRTSSCSSPTEPQLRGRRPGARAGTSTGVLGAVLQPDRLRRPDEPGCLPRRQVLGRRRRGLDRLSCAATSNHEISATPSR